MAETPVASPINNGSVVPAPLLLSDSAAKDVMITWFRGEFAAANAIIDELCSHLMQVSGTAGEEYEGVMAAIHRRRMNWIPLLQMQKYHPISQVTLQLQTATAAKININKLITDSILDDDSPTSDITDSGSREEERVEEEAMTICCKHEEECESLASSLIKQSKRFSAKEHVRGHTASSKPNTILFFTLHRFGTVGDYDTKLIAYNLSFPNAGETFVLFNKNTKGTKRELIQLGIPIFGNTTDEHSVAPIPTLLESVIDHLLQWRLIPEYKRPNGCVINFFDEIVAGDESNKAQPPLTMNRVTLWRQGTPAPPVLNPFGMVRAPLMMLAPAPKRLDAGTGVFLPWTPPVSRKPTKHLPPRVQRLRLLSSAAKSVADREASSSPDIGVS
ncbi:unnamed protein product [Eruca vesicaria subsp. sativa]|uniref:Uncharacterized protein n=1 Tax=Eruca vesicaria subsp. sativa TaxID=29727 RepID=A0ABC8JC94_ERUVS|nr:unnamed protein product [Eruca vesicaria subsp. sativa]